MKTFLHSGKLGDTVFSMATIKAMGGGILYLPEQAPELPNLYSQMKDFCLSQSYIHEVIQCDDCKSYTDTPVIVDVNLNRHREHYLKGMTNMVKRYFDIFGVHGVDYKEPWIEIGGFEKEERGDYSVFNYTGRFIHNEKTGQKSKVYWKKVYDSVEGSKYFSGTEEECAQFTNLVEGRVHRMLSLNVFRLAEFIKGASAIYCNQSLVLSLSCAMGKERWVEFKPGKMNCRFYTENEHAL